MLMSAFQKDPTPMKNSEMELLKWCMLSVTFMNTSLLYL